MQHAIEVHSTYRKQERSPRMDYNPEKDDWPSAMPNQKAATNTAMVQRDNQASISSKLRQEQTRKRHDPEMRWGWRYARTLLPPCWWLANANAWHRGSGASVVTAASIWWWLSTESRCYEENIWCRVRFRARLIPRNTGTPKYSKPTVSSGWIHWDFHRPVRSLNRDSLQVRPTEPKEWVRCCSQPRSTFARNLRGCELLCSSSPSLCQF